MAGKGDNYGILLQMLAVSPVTELESQTLPPEVDDPSLVGKSCLLGSDF